MPFFSFIGLNIHYQSIFHHYLFQMLICQPAQLHPSHLLAQLNSMIKSLSKILCVPSFNLNLKITSWLNCCVVFTPHGCVLQDLATGRMISSGQAYTTCPLFQTKPTHLKYWPTLICGTNASDILIRRVYNLHLPYYLSLSVNISFSFIIMVVFVPELNR